MHNGILKVNSSVALVPVGCLASIRSISRVRFVLKAELSGIICWWIKLSLVRLPRSTHGTSAQVHVVSIFIS